MSIEGLCRKCAHREAAVAAQESREQARGLHSFSLLNTRVPYLDALVFHEQTYCVEEDTFQVRLLPWCRGAYWDDGIREREACKDVLDGVHGRLEDDGPFGAVEPRENHLEIPRCRCRNLGYVVVGREPSHRRYLLPRFWGLHWTMQEK